MDKRIGVLGGTFNPIHLGHLHIAAEIQKLFALSRVHFVVATVPPHKTPENLIAFTHRHAMVSLATAGIPAFLPSLVELEPEASPFSVDTMDKLARRTRLDKNVLFFIAGGDSLAEVKSWRESERLLNSYNFIFAVRPGTGPIDPGKVLPEKASARVCDLTGIGRVRMRRMIQEQSRGNRIYIVDIGAPDVSATQIRRLAAMGKPIHRLVPAPVCEYIRKLHLYDGGR
jgi:nicotinate-nucleotide adenylyltransferase